jgi:ATP-binding cassette subfamily B protein
VAFLEYAQKFFNPIKDMSDKYNILQSALASCERIFHVLDSDPAPEYLPGPKEVLSEAAASAKRADSVDESVGVPVDPSPRPAIEFRDVWFSYSNYGGGDPEGRGPVLRGVSFVISEGEMGAIVGATGAGKTTILSLLCRLYEIERGKILFFGRDIREIPREELRGRISLVLQDPFLFSGTVLENIGAGGPAVETAVSAAGVAGFVGTWEKGLSTSVGERGGQLSVGQRQLVSFARALARNPDVLLLDEATSSVDPVTESEIRKALSNILSGRTSLVVAHRLSTILSADRIIVLHKGKVRETGTHRELMDAGGIYRRLYMLQYERKVAG